MGFRTLAADGVPCGAPVCNNYGAKGNEEFMIQYGFALPDNAHDVHTLVLRLQGPAAAPETFYVRRADHRWPQFPPELWSALGRAGGNEAAEAEAADVDVDAAEQAYADAYAVAADPDADTDADEQAYADAYAIAHGDGDSDADEEQCAVGAEEVGLLRRELQRRLEPYAATADRDDAIARGDPDAKRRFAAHYRAGQRAVLREAVETLDEMLGLQGDSD